VLRRILPEPYLPALTAAWITGLFTASTAPLPDLWRPLLIGIGLAVALGVIVRVASRGGRWAAIAVSAGWMLALGAWPFALLIALVVAWRGGVDLIRRRQGRRSLREAPDAQVTRVLGAIAASALLVTVVGVSTSGAVRLDGAVATPAALQAADAGPPSIYLVLLDGYPAGETLAADLGFDNSGFHAQLEDRGFDVASNSRSNYNRTLLTLASMLHMEYVDAIGPLGAPGDGFAAQSRQLTAAINRAPVPQMLAEAGYRTVAIPASYGEAALTSADEVVRSGTMTLFEEQLLRYTALGGWVIDQWPDLIAEQHRRGVLAVTNAFGGLATRSDPPLFALAHVFSPHTPFVFDSDGSAVPPLDCYPRRCGLTTPELSRLGIDADDYAEALTSQLTYLNTVLLTEVDRLLAADPSAVIILFSDHGARYEEGPSDEHFRTFFAARTPTRERLFADEVSLVDVFPILFGAYFGAELPTHAYRAGWAPDHAPLEVEPIDLQPDR
jgi:hypothetical protein